MVNIGDKLELLPACFSKLDLKGHSFLLVCLDPFKVYSFYTEEVLPAEPSWFEPDLTEFVIPRKTTLPQDSAERKAYPLYRGLLRYFPAACAAVARVSKIGSDKHNPGEEMHHARSKSTDQEDCIMRHLTDLAEDFGKGVGRDENGIPQVDYIAWRALALCQIWHEKHDGAPMAPGAKP